MNADTPRLTTNPADARHLNSVHDVYLGADLRELGRELLPLASLNSVTMLDTEMVDRRSYGGGILKIEPREADVWAMPSPAFVAARAEQFRHVRDRVARNLRAGKLAAAVDLVDQVLLIDSGAVSTEQVVAVRDARSALADRRRARGSSGGAVAAEPTAKMSAWALFDRIVADAAPGGVHSNPWVAGTDETVR